MFMSLFYCLSMPSIPAHKAKPPESIYKIHYILFIQSSIFSNHVTKVILVNAFSCHSQHQTSVSYVYEMSYRILTWSVVLLTTQFIGHITTLQTNAYWFPAARIKLHMSYLPLYAYLWKRFTQGTIESDYQTPTPRYKCSEIKFYSEYKYE